jgi:hypothetical protein
MVCFKLSNFLHYSVLDKTFYNMYRGCYLDNPKKRVLPGFQYDLANNSPEQCIQYCLRIGFQLAGK